MRLKDRRAGRIGVQRVRRVDRQHLRLQPAVLRVAHVQPLMHVEGTQTAKH